MRLLLDTHVVLWLTGGLERVPREVTRAVADADECCVSFASAWEYGAKRAKFPDRLPKPFADLIEPKFTRLGCDFELHRYAGQLPLIHHDPFDRMLIAQAIHNGLTLVTSDAMIRRYPIETLW